MDENYAVLITRFYSAMQNLNYDEMQRCYHADAQFSDPVFGKLKADEVRAMWQMLLTRSQDLQVAFSNISATTTTGKCRWEAWYTFSKTGRMVHNIVQSTFEFKDDKIFRQADVFNLWRWSGQALGVAGIFLGWSPWIKNEIRDTARKSLKKFMESKGN